MRIGNTAEKLRNFWAVQSWTLLRDLARPAVLNRVIRNQQLSLVDRLSAWRVLSPRDQSIICLTPYLQLGIPYSDPPKFSLKESDVESIYWALERKLADTGGDESVEILRAMDVVESLPETVPEFQFSITISVRQGSADGTSGSEWASIEADDYYLSCSVGEHFYAPEAGGDGTSEMVYECNGDGSESGDFDQWLRSWERIARQKFELLVSIED